MKQFNKCKSLLLASLLGGAGVVQAQVANTSHPLAFETVVGTSTLSNYYKDYVGTRLQVNVPTAIAGDYVYTTSTFAPALTAPIVDVPIYMPPGSASGDDSFACSGFLGTTASDMAGKIAVVWRGPIGPGACFFDSKAAYCEAAGAIAVIIINEYPGEGPIPMGAGSGATVGIPVFMVGNLDGIKIAGQYRAAPGSVKMTITPWGKSLAHDIGFVPAGISIWNNCAIPAKQLTGSFPLAYKGIDGAFVANYGTNDVNNVKLATDVTFTPTGGSASSVHTSTLTVTPSASSTTFAALDSIYTVFSSEYDLSGVTGQGRVDINYSLSMTESDDFIFDNTAKHSFFTTDSIFSKARYDFVNHHPISTAWFSPAAPYMWGVPYFVAKGGDAIKDIQFSASTGPGLFDPSAPNVNFYIFKWTDGSAGGGSTTPDGAVEGGELELIGTGIYAFAPTDSSFGFFNAKVTNDTDLGDLASTGMQVMLEDNTTYLVTAEVPGPTTIALGNDGIVSAYPRSYGRDHFHSNSEIYNPIIGADKATMRANPTAAWLSYTFGGGSFDVDSVVYSSQNGLIPALAMRVKPFNVGVNPVAANNNKVELFPNPAADQLNVSLDLTAQVKTVTFTILNTAGQVVSRETKNNVQKDQFSFSTSNFASGNYFMVINADGKTMHRKFTVIK